MAIFTPWSAAWATMSGHTLVNSAKFSFSGLSLSLPMNVLTTGTPSLAAASTTMRRWAMTSARCSRSGCSGFG